MEKKEMSFAMAMKDYFGLKQGDKLKDFFHELKELTDEDRKEFAKGLEQVGYTIK